MNPRALFEKNSVARNSAILFAGSMGANILNYIYHFVVGRLVSVSVYGTGESLISLISFISVPAAAITMLATKYAAMCKAEENTGASRRFSARLTQTVLLYSVVIFLVALALTPLIKDFLHLESVVPLYLLWLLMIVLFLSAVNLGVMAGWQKFTQSSIAAVVGGVIKLAAAIFLIWGGFQVNAIIGSFLLGGIATYLVSVIVVQHMRTSASADSNEEAPALKNYIWPVLVGNLAITILGNADMLFAKHNLDAITAGQYGSLSVVSKIIFFGTSAIATVVFAMAAERQYKSSPSLYIFQRAAMVTGIVTIIATIIYFAVPRLLLKILYGSTYVSVAPYLGWFAIAVSLYSFSNLVVQYLLSIHETRVVYAYLAASVIGSAGMLMFGTTLVRMSILLIATQALAAGTAVFMLWRAQRRNAPTAPFLESIPVPR